MSVSMLLEAGPMVQMIPVRRELATHVSIRNWLMWASVDWAMVSIEVSEVTAQLVFLDDEDVRPLLRLEWLADADACLALAGLIDAGWRL